MSGRGDTKGCIAAGGGWRRRHFKGRWIAVWFFVFYPVLLMAFSLDPDKLTLEDFSFICGADKEFIAAYKVFLKAKAGDQAEGTVIPTYGQAAREFSKIVERTGNMELKFRGAWLMTFCQFLDMDIAAAARSAFKTLSGGLEVYPEECAILESLWRRVESGVIDDPRVLASSLDVEGLGVTGTPLEREVIRQLADIVTRSRLTGELRGKISAYALRTKVRDAGSTKEQLTGMLIVAGLFQKASIAVAMNKEKIDQALCVVNLRLLGVYLYLYAQDHHDVFPTPWDAGERIIWQMRLLPYTGDRTWKERGGVWKCPSIIEGYSYGINQNVARTGIPSRTRYEKDQVSYPCRTMLLADAVHYVPGTYPAKPIYSGAAFKIGAALEHPGTGTVDWHRHGGGANVLFIDGRVEWNSGVRVEEEFWRVP